MDRLSILLAQFGVRAGTFHSGNFCGISAFDETHQHGHLHLLRTGRMKLVLADGAEVHITEPTLIFFPGPYRHRVLAGNADQAELVCASLHFDGGIGNPLISALPDYFILPIDAIPTLGSTLHWLFEEAVGEEYGYTAVSNRLFELLVIQLLRYTLQKKAMGKGVLAGLTDPRIARALTMIHTAPQQSCTVQELANAANMSRAGFAAHFKAIVGNTPSDYLLSWRVGVVQKRLREGISISIIAEEVGYESPSALARAFRRKAGCSPRDWLRSQEF